ncbi:putative ribonuclease H-like domain-containing protein [Tanacetum coccineum]
MAPRAVLMKTCLKSFNTERPVNTVRSINTGRPFSTASTSSQQDQDNQDCIVMPILKDASYFGDVAPRYVVDAQIQDKDGLHDENDATEKSHDDSSLKDNGTAVNTATPEINTGSRELERKNRTLIEAARTMLADSKLPTTFWAEAVSTACYWLHELFLMTLHVSKGVLSPSTSSQQDQDNQDCIIMPIWKDASYFGDAAPRFVADAQIQDKDGPEINTGSREVSTAVPEVNTATPEDLVGPSHASKDTQVEDQEVELGNIPQSYAVPTTPHTRIHKDHPIEHVIGDVQSSVQTRRMKTSYSEQGFLSAIYEGKPNHAQAMQEELLQFKLQKVWILVDLPKGHRAIGTKWVYRNKKDERGIVIRNKARLVAQGHTQERAIYYDEVFAPFARIEASECSSLCFPTWDLWLPNGCKKVLPVWLD